MTLTHPHDLPDTMTGAELANLVYDCDAVADEGRAAPLSDAEASMRRGHYRRIAEVAKWHRVTGRDAGQREDVAVHLGPHRVAYYRKARAQQDGEPDVMPIPASVRAGWGPLTRALMAGVG